MQTSLPIPKAIPEVSRSNRRSQTIAASHDGFVVNLPRLKGHIRAETSETLASISQKLQSGEMLHRSGKSRAAVRPIPSASLAGPRKSMAQSLPNDLLEQRLAAAQSGRSLFQLQLPTRNLTPDAEVQQFRNRSQTTHALPKLDLMPTRALTSDIPDDALG